MNFLQDLRFGFRMLFKNPGFTAISVLTLALGIGANTAIFSIVYGMMLKPLEYKDPDSLVFLWGAFPAKGWDTSSVSIPNYLDWKEQSNSFESMGLYFDRSYNLTGGDRPQRIEAIRCTASLLPTLGIEPQLGRKFDEQEEKIGTDRVLLITDNFWNSGYGRQDDVLGTTITLDNVDFTIIGILPPALDNAWGLEDVWMPLAVDLEAMGRGRFSFEVLARLSSGVSVKQAQVEMSSISAHLVSEYPDDNLGWTVNVEPIMEDVLGKEGFIALYTLMAAVFFVLLIACSNMANLLLARSSVRQKELSIRSALGAGKLRLIRQMITECLLLSLLGGMFGLLLAYWGVDALVASMPEGVPRKDEIRIDQQVLLYTLGISLVSAFLFGLAPAVKTSGINVMDAIKDGARSTSDGVRRHRGRDMLVVGQIAMALALVISAGLMIKSFLLLQKVDPGFNTENLLTLRTNLPVYSYETEEQIAQFYRQACENIERTPGVVSATIVSTIPLGHSRSGRTATLSDYTPPEKDNMPILGYVVVSPGYFKTMEIPLMSGRTFMAADTKGSQEVVIVNRELVERYWPGQEPLGKRIKYGDEDSENPWMTVIGVVDSVKHKGLDEPVRVETYCPFDQASRSYMTFAVRTETEPMALAGAIQSAIWEVDPDQALFEVRSMQQMIYDDIGAWDTFANVLSALAAIAMTLAAIGLYGLMSYNVGKRTQEIGIRVALGAQSNDVLKLVMRKSIILTLIGVVCGLGLGAVMGLGLQSLMYGVSWNDPFTFITVSLMLVAVAMLATFIPARRALAVDPMTALRYE